MGGRVEQPCDLEGPTKERLRLLLAALIFYSNMGSPGKSVLSSHDGEAKRAIRNGTILELIFLCVLTSICVSQMSETFYRSTHHMCICIFTHTHPDNSSSPEAQNGDAAFGAG